MPPARKLVFSLQLTVAQCSVLRYPIEKLNVKNDVKNDVKNGVKNDVKNWDSFLRHFLRQESVVLTSDIEKVCVHVVNNGTDYLCVVPNLYSYLKNIVDSLYLIEYTLIESVN